jgi:hypothetical protein
MTTADLVPTDLDARAEEVSRQVAAARTQAEAIEVRNPDEAERAGRLLREIAARKKQVEDDRKKLKEPILEAGRRVDKQAKDAVASLDAVDAIVRPKLSTYTAEQERLRQEEEARLEAERQERERKAREERERQEVAERAKREQAQREAREAEEEAARAQDAEDVAAAAELAEEARRKAEEAATAEAAISSLPEPALPKATVAAPAKPTGISQRKVWKHTVVKPELVPREFLVVDEKAIRQAVRDGVREIPGVRIEQVAEMAVRS